MIIACDSKNVWRREYFPNYKAGRKANREKSDHDWDAIFNILHNIKDEIIETLRNDMKIGDQQHQEIKKRIDNLEQNTNKFFLRNP